MTTIHGAEYTPDGFSVRTAEFRIRRPGTPPSAIVEETGVIPMRVMTFGRTGRALKLDAGMATDGAWLLKRRSLEVLEFTRRHRSEP